MRLTQLPRAYSGLRRYRQILAVLLKYGFGDLLARLKVRHPLLGRLPRLRAIKELEDLSRPARLRLAFEELGPTFIKLGQLLSLRLDLLPSEYAAELAKLQDEAMPLPFAQIKGKGRGPARPSPGGAIPGVRGGAARRGLARPGPSRSP
jgi:ubiquinone biosynthesis protein